MNISTNSEVWKDVVGYEGLYKVSEYGEVLNIKRNRIMKSHRHGKGYDRIGLTFLGSQRNHYVHRLVGNAFLEPPEHIDQTQINHIDGNKNNNHYSNLEWVTASENMKHASKIGLLKTPNSIEEKDKEVMAYLYVRTRLSQDEIADVFGVSGATVSLAVKKCK